MQAQAELREVGLNDWIASITYKSEAVRTPSPHELQSIVSAARARNGRVGVTGMLLCDGGRYLQTIEGPPEGVDEVWRSILRDPRHAAIEVLSHHMVPARLFSGWEMQLYCLDGDRQTLSPAGSGRSRLLADYIPAAARFALDGEEGRLNAMIGDLVAEGWTGEALATHLLEPTARALGDAWLADDCSEIDLTIALSMLQLAGHAAHWGTPEGIRTSSYTILLATAPGEPHLLGPSLLGDLFNDAGWTVDIAFPDSDDALARRVRSQRPDAVDIALSDALPRQHALASLRDTVAKCRSGASNEMMVVSVGGRLFAEAAATAASVGADHARTGAAGTSFSLSRLIEQRRLQDRQF